MTLTLFAKRSQAPLRTLGFESVCSRRRMKTATPCGPVIFHWLGVRDSNPRMPGPKPGALPLGEPPTHAQKNLRPLNLKQEASFRQTIRPKDPSLPAWLAAEPPAIPYSYRAANFVALPQEGGTKADPHARRPATLQSASEVR